MQKICKSAKKVPCAHFGALITSLKKGGRKGKKGRPLKSEGVLVKSGVMHDYMNTLKNTILVWQDFQEHRSGIWGAKL